MHPTLHNLCYTHSDNKYSPIPWIPRESFNNGYRNVNLFHVLQLETDSVEVLNDISAKSKELGFI